MLQLERIVSGYGETRVVDRLDLTVVPGQVHALLGRNGVGKTTTIKTIMGLLPVLEGKVRFDGVTISGKPCYQIARAGIAWVSETRDIFSSLSVLENLQLAARIGNRDSQWCIEQVLEFFPALQQRLTNYGHQLSGGEQQMLAIGRALLTAPKLLLLDEPTEGLAPILVGHILQKLHTLKKTGMTVVLVEQNLRFALALADQISLMGRGSIVWEGTPQALQKNKEIQHCWLGV